MMKTLAELKGNWTEIQGKLKQEYASLTEDDVLWKEGMHEELIGRLQAKLGKSKEEVEAILSNV